MLYEGGNKILTMLEQRRIPLGIQCFTGSTALVEVMGATGFDFVMFDAEHSGNNARAMEELVRTATLAGIASYIRVPDPHNATDVRRAGSRCGGACSSRGSRGSRHQCCGEGRLFPAQGRSRHLPLDALGQLQFPPLRRVYRAQQPCGDAGAGD